MLIVPLMYGKIHQNEKGYTNNVAMWQAHIVDSTLIQGHGVESTYFMVI